MATQAAIDLILRRLAKYDGLRVEHSDHSIIVLAPQEGGFDVRLVVRGDHYVISFDSWRRAIGDIETAWSFMVLGLSNGSRLRLEPTPEAQTLHWLEVVLPDGSWRTLPEEGHEPNRHNAAVYYRQNEYVRASYRSQHSLLRSATYESKSFRQMP